MNKGKKSTIKYSIRDSQQSFLINVDTVSQFKYVIAKKKRFIFLVLTLIIHSKYV